MLVLWTWQHHDAGIAGGSYIKDWVGHTGKESGRMLALGASFLNLSIWKRDSESAISLQTPGIWIIQTVML